MSEKLDDYSKIIIATASINYMAHQINTVIAQTKGINNPEVQKMVNDNETVLFDFKGRIHEICEDMANFMNAVDMVQPIDDRIVTTVIEILNGEDDMDK